MSEFDLLIAALVDPLERVRAQILEASDLKTHTAEHAVDRRANIAADAPEQLTVQRPRPGGPSGPTSSQLRESAPTETAPELQRHRSGQPLPAEPAAAQKIRERLVRPSQTHFAPSPAPSDTSSSTPRSPPPSGRIIPLADHPVSAASPPQARGKKPPQLRLRRPLKVERPPSHPGSLAPTSAPVPLRPGDAATPSRSTLSPSTPGDNARVHRHRLHFAAAHPEATDSPLAGDPGDLRSRATPVPSILLNQQGSPSNTAQSAPPPSPKASDVSMHIGTATPPAHSLDMQAHHVRRSEDLPRRRSTQSAGELRPPPLREQGPSAQEARHQRSESPLGASEYRPQEGPLGGSIVDDADSLRTFEDSLAAVLRTAARRQGLVV